MKNNHLYILLFGATLTSVIIILLKYFQEKKKKKKEDEHRKNEYLKCKSLFHFEQLAKKSMEAHRFYYFNYKSGQGHTYKACREYFDKQLRILPRVLIDVNQISLKRTIFGCTYESSIVIAPSAFHCFGHVDGEVGTARGATEAECIYTYNWMYSTMTEDKVLETTGSKFLHIYLNASNKILEKLVAEADKKEYRAIVIACDDPTTRVRDEMVPLFLDASKYSDAQLL